MPAREFRRQWDSWRIRVREHASHLTPSLVVLFPFEVLVSIIGLLVGPPMLLGLTKALGLLAVVGTLGVCLWALALTLGAATVLYGLLHPRSPLVLASGLSLSALAYVSYALTVIAVLGSASAWGYCVIFLGLAAVALARATHFRRIIDIQKGARRLLKGER